MKFRTPKEALAARPNIDLTASMRVDEYAGLTGENDFQEHDYVECQLINKFGNVCRRKHGSGFVARRHDAVEMFIGGDCAATQFGAVGEAGQKFINDAALMQRKNRIDDLLARIAARKADPAYNAALRDDWARHDLLHKRISAVRGMLPLKVLGRIVGMGRTANRGVPGEVKYVEPYVDDEGKPRERITWQAVTLAVVTSPDGIDLAKIEAERNTLKVAGSALRMSLDDISHLETRLTEVIVVIDAAVGSSARMDAIEASLDAFCTAENFRAVSWLATRSADQEAVAELALRKASQPCQPRHVQAAIQSWRKEIEQRHGGREFQIVQ
jgi:hypothetical protein